MALYRAAVVILTAAACAAVLLLWGPRRPALDEETVLRIFPQVAAGARLVYDPVSVVALRPDRSASIPWPEHPSGRIAFVTNNLGLREDGPTTERPSGRRVIVVGDSHTDGVVPNAESFANVLESRLGDGTEVLNAGVGGTGPFEILGAVRKRLALSPDVVVAALFSGNDFANGLALSPWFGGPRPSSMPEEAARRLAELRETWRKRGLEQGFGQAFTFKNRPDDPPVALDTALHCYRAMAAACAEQGVGFVVVVLPTKADVDDGVWPLADELGLQHEDLGVNRRLAERFVAALEADGIVVVDPYTAMATATAPLYWVKDHHLNTAGHAIVAEALLEPVRALLPSP